MALSHHSPSGMPKVSEDLVLQQRLAVFVDSCGGTRQAAKRLELEHTMVWRFHKSARAIARNQLAISAALNRQKTATATENATENAAAHSIVPTPVPVGDLAALRTFCLSVLALIDNYNRPGGGLAAVQE